jgi:short-subunit dehydrogenase
MLTARNELASEGIAVNLVHPSLTKTNFIKHSIRSSKEDSNGPVGIQAVAPVAVAEKILEAIINEPAEQYMDERSEGI